MEAHDKDLAQQPRKKDPPKKEYHTPKVVEYGDLRELTQTNSVVVSQSDGIIEVTNA